MQRLFYKIANKITKIELVDGARDFRLMKREVVNAILDLKEYNRFSKGIFQWVGFETKWLEYENIERQKRRNQLVILGTVQIFH